MIQDDRIIEDQVRTKLTKKDHPPDHRLDGGHFQDEQTKKELVQMHEVHEDHFHDQQAKKDPLHETHDSISQLQRQKFKIDQVLGRSNEGQLQNPQIQFQNQKTVSRTFHSEIMKAGKVQQQQRHQQQDSGQRGNLRPDLPSSVPGSGVTLKSFLSTLENHRHNQGISQPVTLVAASSLIQDYSQLSTSPHG